MSSLKSDPQTLTCHSVIIPRIDRDYPHPCTLSLRVRCHYSAAVIAVVSGDSPNSQLGSHSGTNNILSYQNKHKLYL